MTEPREPSRFHVPAVDAVPHRVNALAAIPPGYSDVVRLGPMSESVLSVAWRGRWVILLCVILAIVAGLVYVQTSPPLYTSTSKLYLDYVNITPLTFKPERPPQIERYLHTQAGLLRSRPILARAVQALERQPLQTFVDVDAPVEFVGRNILVEVGRRDDIIGISFNSPDPVEAAQIVNSVVEAYMASRSEHEQRNAAHTLRILNDDLERARIELAQKQTELEAFQKNHIPSSLGSEAGIGAVQRYLGLQAELSDAQVAMAQAKLFRDAVNLLSSDPEALRQYIQLKGHASSYIGAAQKAPFETRRAELTLKVENLSNRLTTDHPRVAALMNQLSAIEARLTEQDDRFVSAAVTAAEQSYKEALDNEKRFSQLCDEGEERIAALNAEINKYQRFRSEVDRLGDYHQSLEKHVREIARMGNEDVGQLRMAILEPAIPAGDPSEPQKSRILAAALLLGLLVGGCITLARDSLDHTLRSTDEISSRFGIASLGVVPTMSRHLKAAARSQQVFRQPDSRETEAFRAIRTAILFGAPREHAKVFLVASPNRKEGRSTVVSNLGIAMALAGQKTIVVDADLRHPVQHLIHESDPHVKSLADILGGKAKLCEAICSTQVKGLSLLVSRGGFPNPAEILNGPQFARLLRILERDYDCILVDTPPVNGVADAQIIAAGCDFTILVLKACTTTRETSQRAIEKLQNVGAPILGVVMNQVTKGNDRYGYHHGWYERDHRLRSNGKKDKTVRDSHGSHGSVPDSRPEDGGANPTNMRYDRQAHDLPQRILRRPTKTAPSSSTRDERKSG